MTVKNVNSITLKKKEGWYFLMVGKHELDSDFINRALQTLLLRYFSYDSVSFLSIHWDHIYVIHPHDSHGSQIKFKAIIRVIRVWFIFHDRQ